MKTFLHPGDYELASILNLAPHRKVSGFSVGEQRSPAVGGGIEFADYREYAPGDELRQIDWHVFLRFRKLMVKLAAEEKELTLVVLIDASASMGYGSPDKLTWAKRLACILAGAALHGGNRAAIAVMRPGFVEALGPERGKASMGELVRVAGSIKASGGVVAGERAAGSASATARQFASRYGRKCVSAILSDFMYPDWRATIAALGAGGSEILALQILAPDELRPDFLGETLLVDSEDGQETPLHIDAGAAERYRDRLEAFTSDVRAACIGAGITYSLAPTDGDPARLFRSELAGKSFVC